MTDWADSEDHDFLNEFVGKRVHWITTGQSSRSVRPTQWLRIETHDGRVLEVAGRDLAIQEIEEGSRRVSAENEIDVLGRYIMEEVPGEPSRSEGAGHTAVRLLRCYRGAMDTALHELGVPQPETPAPIVNAVTLLRGALDRNETVDLGGLDS